jgi:putative transcriptional regulator
MLVATPIITEPPFSRTVVALIEHDDEGALGLIINLPSDLPVAEFLPEATADVVPPKVIFVGGPVGTDSALGVVMAEEANSVRRSPFAGVSLVDPTDPELERSDMRVFGGFAGWSPGQLEAEIREGAWWSVSAHREDFFAQDPESLWEATVRRVKGRTPLYATFPDDPSSN